MTLLEDLQRETRAIFQDSWKERDGQKVPKDEDLGLGNDAVKLRATVLYADIADSTKLVDGHANFFASEVYKSFLRCATKVIKDQGGEITAYDGDRVMAVFIGDKMNTRAVRAGMKITWAVEEIIRPEQKRVYTQSSYELRHVVGIDTSDIFISRAGIRGSNDLVWVSRAANHAAKLAAMDDEYPLWITQEVYEDIDHTVKSTQYYNFWNQHTWTAMGNRLIYRTKSHWPIN